ncbi:MAG: phosphotransferase family protein [Thermoplasmata archaeon]
MNDYKEALLLDIINHTYPELSIESYRLYAWSWNSYVVEINDSLIFKIPKTAKNQALLEREISVSNFLSQHLKVSVPRYEFTKKYKDSKLVAGYRKIPGSPLTNQTYAGLNIGAPMSKIRAKAKIIAQLSGILVTLHSFPVDEFISMGVPDESGKQWKERYELFYYEVHDAVYPYLKKPLKKKIEKVFDRFLNDQTNFEFEPALIHGDFGGWNLLFDALTMKITGVIDWENAVIGDAALDFAELLYDYGQEVTEKILKRYNRNIDARFAERMKFYRSMAGLHDVIYGSRNSDIEILKRGLDAIKHDLG